MTSSLPPIIIAVYQLGFGGATHAVFDEARLFSELGHRTIIATFNNDPGFEESVEAYRRLGRISAKVEVRNLHWDTQHQGRRFGKISRRKSSIARRWHSLPAWGAARSTVTEGPLRVVRTFSKAGHLTKVQKFNGSGTLVELQRISRDGVLTLDWNQPAYCYYRTRRNLGDAHAFSEQYFANDRFCYMSRTIDPRTGYGSGVDVFRRRSRTAQHFHGIPAWQTYWLQSLVDEVGGHPIVIGEAPSIIPKIVRLRPDSAVRIAKLHNNHNEIPYLPGSDLRSDHAEIFAVLEKFDAVVVLTEGQRNDIIERHNAQANIVVIPNVLWPRESLGIERDPDLVGIVSRIAPQKAIADAVEAFRLVLQARPTARLRIWGRGSDQGKIRDLIAKYNLGANIEMMGRTEDPDHALQSCSFTVSTSLTESFSLAIAESSLNGTPVVSYDCPFGPRSLIQDQVTGVLVERGDVTGLAAQIVSLLDDPERARNMGAAAQDYVSRIVDPAVVVPKWERLFSKLAARHP